MGLFSGPLWASLSLSGPNNNQHDNHHSASAPTIPWGPVLTHFLSLPYWPRSVSIWVANNLTPSCLELSQANKRALDNGGEWAQQEAIPDLKGVLPARVANGELVPGDQGADKRLGIGVKS